MKKKAHIIIGLGYGDEGKGLVTDFLCKHAAKPIVIRFNGGQQAGHTVFFKSDKKHIFSNFGAGTLRDAPTYWSKYCTFSPGFFLDEYKLLPKTPKIFIDYLCPVTTHYDVLYNRATEIFKAKNNTGSCGLGFGATIQRHKTCAVKLVASDLFNKSNCRRKLKAIREYYKLKLEKETNFLFSAFNHNKEDIEFINDLNQIKLLSSKKILQFSTEREIFRVNSKWNTYIFEGAQGILLDINHGYRPYVTKSNTTSKNALALLRNNCDLSELEIEIIYVTRAYQTRHGKGPFKQCKIPLKLKNVKSETNKYNQFQGKFRVSHLDIDKLNYALKCDNNYSKKIEKNLFVTCLDQLDSSNIEIYMGGKKRTVHYATIPTLLNCRFSSVKFNFSRIAR